MSIQIDSIQKTFGGAPVLKDISLTIETGEMAALLGPSGSGKTTLLRIIAGLETETSGRILFDGADMTDVSARDRRVGFVFQNYALFRHMTAAENIAFGLTVRKGAEKLPKADIEARVRDLLAMVQLTDFAGRYPAQLSGGQQQRVALARALATDLAFCFLTSLSAPSMLRFARTSGNGSDAFMKSFALRAFSSRTIRKRPCRLQTASW